MQVDSVIEFRVTFFPLDILNLQEVLIFPRFHSQFFLSELIHDEP